MWFSIKFGVFHVVTDLLIIRCHFEKGAYPGHTCNDFFNAVSIRTAIFTTRCFSEIYIHYEVFNRGTNLVSV